jgi:hypothetical protein
MFEMLVEVMKEILASLPSPKGYYSDLVNIEVFPVKLFQNTASCKSKIKTKSTLCSSSCIIRAWIAQSGWLRAGMSALHGRQGQEILLYSTEPRSSMAPTQPPVQWISLLLFTKTYWLQNFVNSFLCSYVILYTTHVSTGSFHSVGKGFIVIDMSNRSPKFQYFFHKIT